MMVRLKKRKRKWNKSEEQMCVQTRPCNEVFYTKSHVSNDSPDKSTGGALPKIVSHEILKMQWIKKGFIEFKKPVSFS